MTRASIRRIRQFGASLNATRIPTILRKASGRMPMAPALCRSIRRDFDGARHFTPAPPVSGIASERATQRLE